MALSDELPVPKAAGGASRRALFVAAIGLTALLADHRRAERHARCPGRPRLGRGHRLLPLRSAVGMTPWAAAAGFGAGSRWRSGVWLVSETVRLLGAWTGQPALLAELSVVVFAVASAGTYVAVVRGRMRKADEMAFYLDAAAVFFGLMAVVVLIGSGLLNDGQSVSLLAHGAFFLGILAVTLLLLLATHAPLRFAGAWEMLAGVSFAAAGYLGLLTVTGPQSLTAGLHLAVAFGALLAGHGVGCGPTPRITRRAT